MNEYYQDTLGEDKDEREKKGRKLQEDKKMFDQTNCGIRVPLKTLKNYWGCQYNY